MCVCVCGGGGGGARGGGGAGVVTGIILVRVCEPIFRNLPHSYTWPLKKRTHSYTRSPDILPIHILPVDFLYPFMFSS